MSFDDTQKPARKPGYYLENLENEMLLFNPQQTKVMYLNETASLIWQLCDGQHNIQMIINLLADAYPEAATRIAADVMATLEQFLAHDVIVLM